MPSYTRRNATVGDIIITKASNAISHCGIVVKNKDVAHATNSGLKLNDVDLWTTASDVFRPKDLKPEMVDALDTIARKLIDSGSSYSKSRAAFKSWTGTSSFGSGARERLAKYKARMAIDPAAGPIVPVVKNVFCSEFVILCYQLACADETARHFIKLDGKHALPKDLRSYITNNPTYWEGAGEAGGR